MSNNRSLESLTSFIKPSSGATCQNESKSKSNLKLKEYQKEITSSMETITHNCSDHPIKMITTSPCGLYVVAGNSDGELIILNIARNHLEKKLKGSARQLISLYFSPCGRFLLCGYSSLLEIWDFNERTLMFSIPMSSEYPAPAIFTADGKLIAKPIGNKIYFWNFDKKTKEFKLKDDEEITSIACSADGRHFVSGSSKGKIIFWNLELRKPEFQICKKQKKIFSIAISNDGKISVFLFESYFVVWNNDERNKVNCEKNIFSPYSISLSPDGKTLALGESHTKCIVYNIESRKYGYSFINQKEKELVVALSLDQKAIFCGSYDGKLYISKTLNKIKFTTYTESSETSIISLNSEYFCSKSRDGRLKIYTMKDKQLRFILNESLLNNFVFEISANGFYLYSSTYNCVRILNLRTNEEVFKIDLENYGFLREMTKSSRCDHHSISKDFAYVACKTNGIFQVWDVFGKVNIFNVGKDQFHVSSDFSIDSKLGVFGFSTGYISIWKITEKCEIYSLKCNPGPLLKLKFTNDLKYLIYTSAGILNVWNLNKKTLKHKIDINTYSPYFLTENNGYLIFYDKNELCLFYIKENLQKFYVKCDHYKLSYNFKHLMISSESHTEIIKLQSFLEIQTFDNYKQFVPFKFSRNQKLAVSGHEKIIKLWNVEENKEILTFKAHKHWIRAVAFSYDNQFIVSGADDGCVKIWDLNGREIQCFYRNMSWVLAVAFSRNGRNVVSASNDNVVVLWQVGRRKKLRAYREFNEILSVSFSSSGKFIAIETIHRNKIFTISRRFRLVKTKSW